MTTTSRRTFIAGPLYKFAKGMMPKISDTERAALNAGTVGFDRNIFCGNPSSADLAKYKIPKFSPDEQSFMDNENSEVYHPNYRKLLHWNLVSSYWFLQLIEVRCKFAEVCSEFAATLTHTNTHTHIHLYLIFLFDILWFIYDWYIHTFIHTILHTHTHLIIYVSYPFHDYLVWISMIIIYESYPFYDNHICILPFLW